MPESKIETKIESKQYLAASDLTKAKAQEIHTLVADKVASLYDRWLDESEYEDIRDYRDNLDLALQPYGTKCHTMSQNPFGFTFLVDGIEYQIWASGDFVKLRQCKQ